MKSKNLFNYLLKETKKEFYVYETKEIQNPNYNFFSEILIGSDLIAIFLFTDKKEQSYIYAEVLHIDEEFPDDLSSKLTRKFPVDNKFQVDRVLDKLVKLSKIIRKKYPSPFDI